MPRIASLYPANQPSSHPSSNRHRRIGRNSYLDPPKQSRSRYSLRFSSRPRTLAQSNRTPRKPSIFGRRSQTSYRSSTSSWRQKFGFRSQSYQPTSQPLSLEEKLRVAADRVRRFERQTIPQVRPQIKTRTKNKRHTRIRTSRASKCHASVRKRDKLQSRLNTFASGKI